MTQDELIKELRAEIQKYPLSSAWASNVEVQEDARKYGVSETILTLNHYGLLPSEVLATMEGRHG